jgi:hypothetical protein
MKKYIFCLEDNLQIFSLKQFRDFLFQSVVPDIMKHHPDNCKLTISAIDQPSFTILPLNRNGFAMFSLAGIDETAIFQELKKYENPQRRVYGYIIHESPYLLCDRTWNCEEESPGLILLTMFQKKQGLTREQFMRIWFGEHSPKAIYTHPLKNYIRNVVTGFITENTPKFDGIVEEHFGCDEDLLNPVRMFGGIFKALPSMINVYFHVSKFLNLSNIRNFICREYLLAGELSVCNEEMRDDIVVKDRGSVLV